MDQLLRIIFILDFYNFPRFDIYPDDWQFPIMKRDTVPDSRNSLITHGNGVKNSSLQYIPAEELIV